MSQIAIDIVLLPDESAQSTCRKINKSIGWKLDFTNTWKTPHISLLMGTIEESQLDDIQKILKEVIRNYSPINLTWEFHPYVIPQTWEDSNSFKLERHSNIIKLFSDISEHIRPNLWYENISAEMFYCPNEVEPPSMFWVKSFENKTPEGYSPHISLWIWKLKWSFKEKIEIWAKTLAVYQLGNYCTCDNKLFEIDL